MRVNVGVTVGTEAVLAGDVNSDASLIANLLESCSLRTNDGWYGGSRRIENDRDLKIQCSTRHRTDQKSAELTLGESNARSAFLAFSRSFLCSDLR